MIFRLLQNLLTIKKKSARYFKKVNEFDQINKVIPDQILNVMNSVS